MAADTPRSEVEPLVRDLLRPEAYPVRERPEKVDLAQTHISWLFFAGPYVYKVKKPLDYGFLDFTSLEKRRHFCYEEVRLNRRLSPDVYLGVVEIRLESGRHTLDGPGSAVEYAVKMRRLPESGWLKGRLERGEISPEDLRRVARRVAEFHDAAETSPEITGTGGLEAVRFNTQENFDQTQGFIGTTLSREAFDAVRAYRDAFLEVKEDLFRAREAEGRIRDSHGDLHTAQVNLENGISFIDCIEFNTRFRYGDVAADVAFTAMDLDYHRREDLSSVFIEEYVERSGDTDVPGLLDFYKCYRAYTRGKVETFRAAQEQEERARADALDRAGRYFTLAHRYVLPTTPLLLIATGMMGTGKTWLTRILASRLDAQLIRSDRIRRELTGLADSERREVAWGEDVYSEASRTRVYEVMHERAVGSLKGGAIVVLDASYQDRRWRAGARTAAQEAGARFLALETRCPLDIVRERLERRRAEGTDVSDGRLEILNEQRSRFHPVVELSDREHVVVDTSGAFERVTLAALREVYRRLLT